MPLPTVKRSHIVDARREETAAMRPQANAAEPLETGLTLMGGGRMRLFEKMAQSASSVSRGREGPIDAVTPRPVREKPP